MGNEKVEVKVIINTGKKEFDFKGKKIDQEWEEFLAQNSKQQEIWDNIAPLAENERLEV